MFRKNDEQKDALLELKNTWFFTHVFLPICLLICRRFLEKKRKMHCLII